MNSSDWKTSELTKFVSEKFKANADPARAPEMAAYMRTDMPFYGIQKPAREIICREVRKKFAPETREQYEDAVLALWSMKRREDKYAALDYAKSFKPFITSASIDLYERLIREGAWWDLVDDIAIWLVGTPFLNERKVMKPIIESWIDDDDMWIRRTALIAHNKHKQKTDQGQLFDHCLRRADEKEFFIRKGIGWALREYSYSAPEAVRSFLLTNRKVLSPLSFKEGAKGLVRKGLMELEA